MKSRLSALGRGLALDVDDPVLAMTLDPLISDLSVPDVTAADGPEDSLLVRVEGKGPWTVSSRHYYTVATTSPEALSATLTAVNLTAVAETPLLAAHAGVVTDGRSAVVVPASSGTGKTTLVTALVQRGWHYLSDEALCLQWHDGRLSAYPRPLALSTWSAAALGLSPGVAGDGESFYAPSSLGAVGSAEGVAIAHIVLLERGHASPRLDPLKRQDALAELLRRSFNHFRDPGRALDLLGGAVRIADTSVLRLGDPAAAADLLTRYLR
jgi:hypothetical protein